MIPPSCSRAASPSPPGSNCTCAGPFSLAVRQLSYCGAVPVPYGAFLRPSWPRVQRSSRHRTGAPLAIRLLAWRLLPHHSSLCSSSIQHPKKMAQRTPRVETGVLVLHPPPFFCFLLLVETFFWYFFPLIFHTFFYIDGTFPGTSGGGEGEPMALSLSLLYSYIQHHSYPSLVPWHLLHRVTHFPLQYDSTLFICLLGVLEIAQMLPLRNPYWVRKWKQEVSGWLQVTSMSDTLLRLTSRACSVYGPKLSTLGL